VDNATSKAAAILISAYGAPTQGPVGGVGHWSRVGRHSGGEGGADLFSDADGAGQRDAGSLTDDHRDTRRQLAFGTTMR
jgi:hypothetical protein